MFFHEEGMSVKTTPRCVQHAQNHGTHERRNPASAHERPQNAEHQTDTNPYIGPALTPLQAIGQEKEQAPRRAAEYGADERALGWQILSQEGKPPPRRGG